MATVGIEQPVALSGAGPSCGTLSRFSHAAGGEVTALSDRAVAADGDAAVHGLKAATSEDVGRAAAATDGAVAAATEVAALGTTAATKVAAVAETVVATTAAAARGATTVT
jgi:hypothetical protein